MQTARPVLEQLEPRMLPTLVFIFAGNALGIAKPDSITQNAAANLIRDGDQAVQLTTPALNSPTVFYQIAHTLRALSHGQPIGLLGFSAGGLLAMRLAEQPGLNVRAVMNYYGPPDLSDWLDYHRDDQYYGYVTSHVHLTSSVLDLLSGVSHSSAYFVNAFGLRDRNVESSVSTADFHRDFQQGRVYYYDGGHGVAIGASIPAFDDFVSHLQED